MKKNEFLRMLKACTAFSYEGYTLYYKPTKLCNIEKKTREKFKNIEDAYENATIDGVPLKEIVESMPSEEAFKAPMFDDSENKIFTEEESRMFWPEDYE